jgi:hypothetical protein
LGAYGEFVVLEVAGEILGTFLIDSAATRKGALTSGEVAPALKLQLQLKISQPTTVVCTQQALTKAQLSFYLMMHIYR